MSHPIHSFLDAGCELARPDVRMLIGIYDATGGNPCTTGCAYYKGGACPAYRKLTLPVNVAVGQQQGETVREMAARLGISLSEARRRRRT